MDNEKKMDAIDLILNIIQEHEEALDKIATKIENLILLKQSNIGDNPDWR
jgi:hypothetical protein